MAFQEYNPKRVLKADNIEFISISKSHIRFSAPFVRKARLTNQHLVRIMVDYDTYRILFSFTKDSGLTLTQPKGKDNLQCSAVGFLSEFDWIKAITTDNKNKNRQFTPKAAGRDWIIDLSPAFDISCKRTEVSKIGETTKGIYRYVRSSSNEIVYIGKGEIVKRLRSPERKDWDFDVIQYSKVQDEQEQFKWESYWIEKFKAEHKKIPFYNIISGKKKKK